MAEQARVLAELMGWKLTADPYNHWKFILIDHLGDMVIGGNDAEEVWEDIPVYDTDLNAMREVWKVLKERGLWDSFMEAWFAQLPIMDSVELWLYTFLNDLPGQVEAAIKVLEKGQGV